MEQALTAPQPTWGIVTGNTGKNCCQSDSNNWWKYSNTCCSNIFQFGIAIMLQYLCKTQACTNSNTTRANTMFSRSTFPFHQNNCVVAISQFRSQLPKSPFCICDLSCESNNANLLPHLLIALLGTSIVSPTEHTLPYNMAVCTWWPSAYQLNRCLTV